MNTVLLASGCVILTAVGFVIAFFRNQREAEVRAWRPKNRRGGAFTNTDLAPVEAKTTAPLPGKPLVTTPTRAPTTTRASAPITTLSDLKVVGEGEFNAKFPTTIRMGSQQFATFELKTDRFRQLVLEVPGSMAQGQEDVYGAGESMAASREDSNRLAMPITDDQFRSGLRASLKSEALSMLVIDELPQPANNTSRRWEWRYRAIAPGIAVVVFELSVSQAAGIAPYNTSKFATIYTHELQVTITSD